MIIGYHVIFGAYGFWLPNDPRGSGSTYVGSDYLYFSGGRATKTTSRKSVAHRVHDTIERFRTKGAMQRPSVRFSGVQARAIARAFGTYFSITKYPVWACAILPDHIHFVVGRASITTERLTQQLRAAATRQMVAEKCHPFGRLAVKVKTPPRCFLRGQRIIYLDMDDVARAIQYVRDNPVKQGLPRQPWWFVQSDPAAHR